MYYDALCAQCILRGKRTCVAYERCGCLCWAALHVAKPPLLHTPLGLCVDDTSAGSAQLQRSSMAIVALCSCALPAAVQRTLCGIDWSHVQHDSLCHVPASHKWAATNGQSECLRCRAGWKVERGAVTVGWIASCCVNLPALDRTLKLPSHINSSSTHCRLQISATGSNSRVTA